MYTFKSSQVMPTDIEERIILEGYSSAKNLEDVLGPILKKAEDGLYRPSDISPAIRFDGTYFSFDASKKNISEQYTPIFKMEDIHGVVVDAYSKLVLTQAAVARKNEILTTEPVLPAIGLQVLRTVIDFNINQRLQHVRSLEWHRRRFADFFIEDPTIYGITLEGVEAHLGHLISSINHFVGNDTWNYYFVCINGTDIMIEKGADYRICEWYVMKQKEHDNPDSYSSRIHRTVGDISNY